MNDNERLEFIMNQISGSATGDQLNHTKISEWLITKGDEITAESESNYLIDRLTDEKLIQEKNLGYFRLSTKGNNIKKSGGYVKYFNERLNERAHQEKIARYTYNIQLSIAIATGVAAIYYAIEIFKPLLFTLLHYEKNVSMNWWSTIGLVLDAIGVCIIFVNALPIEKTYDILWDDAPTPLTDIEVDQHNKRTRFKARIGLGFILAGFIFQLIGSNINYIQSF